MGELVKKSWREASKQDWTRRVDPDKENLTKEEINAGSFMRMADSMETIAKDKTRLEQDAKYWKDSSQRQAAEIELLNNRIRGYKSRITTLMGKITRLGGKA